MSEILRLILPFPSPLRYLEQLKHSQLPRNIEYLWIPLITEAGTIPASLVWRAFGLASHRGSELAPKSFFHYSGADQQSVQFRWQTLTASGTEILNTYSCTSFWGKKYKWICLRMCLQSFNLVSREAANHRERLLTSLAFSHHRYPIIALHMVFACTSKRNASPIQPSKWNEQWFFFLLVLLYFPFPQLTVTEGIRRINHEKRGCSLVKMKPNWEEPGFLFYLLVYVPACTEIIFEILHKHLVWKEKSLGFLVSGFFFGIIFC